MRVVRGEHEANVSEDHTTNFRRYQDGFGITHWVGWDDQTAAWYYWCDHAHAIIGMREDGHDSRDAFPTCFRCIYARGLVRAPIFGSEPWY